MEAYRDQYATLFNNGRNVAVVAVSVDPDTTLTYGFDPQTGRPERGRHMAEAEIFAGIVQALGVSTAGTSCLAERSYTDWLRR